MLGGQLFARQVDTAREVVGTKSQPTVYDFLAVDDQDFAQASLKDARVLCRVSIT